MFAKLFQSFSKHFPFVYKHWFVLLVLLETFRLYPLEIIFHFPHSIIPIYYLLNWMSLVKVQTKFNWFLKAKTIFIPLISMKTTNLFALSVYSSIDSLVQSLHSAYIWKNIYAEGTIRVAKPNLNTIHSKPTLFICFMIHERFLRTLWIEYSEMNLWNTLSRNLINVQSTLCPSSTSEDSCFCLKSFLSMIVN